MVINAARRSRLSADGPDDRRPLSVMESSLVLPAITARPLKTPLLLLDTASGVVGVPLSVVLNAYFVVAGDQPGELHLYALPQERVPGTACRRPFQRRVRLPRASPATNPPLPPVPHSPGAAMQFPGATPTHHLQRPHTSPCRVLALPSPRSWLTSVSHHNAGTALPSRKTLDPCDPGLQGPRLNAQQPPGFRWWPLNGLSEVEIVRLSYCSLHPTTSPTFRRHLLRPSTARFLSGTDSYASWWDLVQGKEFRACGEFLSLFTPSTSTFLPPPSCALTLISTLMSAFASSLAGNLVTIGSSLFPARYSSATAFIRSRWCMELAWLALYRRGPPANSSSLTWDFLGPKPHGLALVGGYGVEPAVSVAACAAYPNFSGARYSARIHFSRSRELLHARRSFVQAILPLALALPAHVPIPPQASASSCLTALTPTSLALGAVQTLIHPFSSSRYH
ncbi:hypothetical protein B0H14DRAFT_3882972 [Mycena olivaceomarginata]|nr:hypothetical protein B0H14DRAFT_3882972 [Mycena olivaceomarginata]